LTIDDLNRVFLGSKIMAASRQLRRRQNSLHERIDNKLSMSSP